MKNIIPVCKARNQHTLSETTISPEIQAASAASAYPGARAETRGAWVHGGFLGRCPDRSRHRSHREWLDIEEAEADDRMEHNKMEQSIISQVQIQRRTLMNIYTVYLHAYVHMYYIQSHFLIYHIR